MSDIKRDGGPAFPLFYPGNQELIPPSTYGMTLRDWFAGQVICGFVSDPSYDASPEGAASWAYRLADAMLKEREK